MPKVESDLAHRLGLGIDVNDSHGRRRSRKQSTYEIQMVLHRNDRKAGMATRV
jgi:hypothetical protein